MAPRVLQARGQSTLTGPYRARGTRRHPQKTARPVNGARGCAEYRRDTDVLQTRYRSGFCLVNRGFGPDSTSDGHADVFHLQELIDPVMAALAAKPGLLDPPERRNLGRDDDGIYPVDPVFQRFGTLVDQ